MSNPALQHASSKIRWCSRGFRRARRRGYCWRCAPAVIVVGFMGDGINDAPSLHAADVGISVSNAVDVARDAAPDHSVSNPGLRHPARTASLKEQHGLRAMSPSMFNGTSSNFGNLLSMAAASLLSAFSSRILSAQGLLENCHFYDLAQIAVRRDSVDGKNFCASPAAVGSPQHSQFMIAMGRSVRYSTFLRSMFCTFFSCGRGAVSYRMVRGIARDATLVLFVIRTFRRQWQSRPTLRWH